MVKKRIVCSNERAKELRLKGETATQGGCDPKGAAAQRSSFCFSMAQGSNDFLQPSFLLSFGNLPFLFGSFDVGASPHVSFHHKSVGASPHTTLSHVFFVTAPLRFII